MRILLDCLFEILDSSFQAVFTSLIPEETTLEIKLISPRVFCEAFLEILRFVRRQSELKCLNDFRRDLLLNVKNVLHRAAIGFCPYIHVTKRINELRCDSEISTLSPDTSFQQVLHAKIDSGLLAGFPFRHIARS